MGFVPRGPPVYCVVPLRQGPAAGEAALGEAVGSMADVGACAANGGLPQKRGKGGLDN